MSYSVSVGKDAYPAELEQDVTLSDGSQLRLRPIRPDDAPRLQALHSRLSRDSIFFRFFSPLAILTDARAEFFATVDYQRRLALVAVEPPGNDDASDPARPDEQIVGVSRYDLDDHGRAEVAIVVEDTYQHHGVGTILFWAILDAARARGITTAIANVLPENARMLHMLQESGLIRRRRRVGGYLAIELDISGRRST
jgi:RimJ/RimL family protein N-acetyltransferase